MRPAPIAIFCYNRPEHLAQTMASLRRCPEAVLSVVHFFSDAPKNEADKDKVKEVRNYITGIQGFAGTVVHVAETNEGLANSIIQGVDQLCNEFGSVIVLEDDMECSPLFLTFMNQALERYEKEERVISIHGYVYPIRHLPSSFFLKGADCWGWATWKRGWDLFEPEGKRLLEEIRQKKLGSRFSFQGAYPYFTMLKRQIRGENQSWAVRWYASALIRDKLTLYPGQSLIRNIGNDDSGTHSKGTALFDPHMASSLPAFPDKIEESRKGYRAFVWFFWKLKVKTVLSLLSKSTFRKK